MPERGIIMRNHVIRKWITVFAVCAAVLSLAACGQNAGNAQPAAENEEGKAVSGDLTLYTSEPEELVADLVAKFNETYPAVNIEVFRSGTGKVTAKMDAELETGSTPANILWFADIGYIKKLDDQGMILHFVPSTADAVDPQYLYNDGMGAEVRLIYNTIAYNTNEVADPPKDWKDVLGEEYKGSFAIADPNYSGGAFTALVTHVQHDDLVGWDWYESLYGNDLKFEESNGNLQTKVASGEYKAVEIVDFMARTAKAEGSPVDVCYPASGSVLVPTPLCLMNNIPDDGSLDAAKAFVEWCFTDEAQEMFVSQQYIPVTGVKGPEGAPSADEITTMPFDLDYFTEHSADIREEYASRFGASS